MFPRVHDVYAGIVRVSFMGSRKTGSDSFHADREQTQAVERYVANIGARVEFMDPELSVSGGKPIKDRPSLQAAIEGVEAGRYAGIVVAYLSRLTRSRSGLEIWERVERAGGTVHCAAENLDTSTPNGRFVRDVHLANAVREREEHVDRFDERREHATAAGVWQRRQVPTGYTKDPRTRKLVPGPKADDVRWAFRQRAAGTPVLHLAQRLKMTASGVRMLLRNRVYLGELKVGEYINPDAHPALITIEEWEAAQITVPRQPRSQLPPALLSGLVVCQGCGHLMGRRATAQVVYQCAKWHSGDHCPDPSAIGANRLEAHVERIALDHLRRLEPTASMITGDLDAAREAVAKAERELGAYVEAVSVEDVGVEAFAAGARTRRRAVDDARDMLRRAQAVAPAAPAYGGALDVWEGLNGHERNTVLRALLEAVVVRKAVGRRTQPVGERVRVVAFGAGMLPERSGARDAGYGIVPVEWPDADGPGVLRVLGGEDAF